MKTIIIIFCSLLFIQVTAQTTDTTKLKNTFSFGPINLASNTFSLSYEHISKHKTALKINPLIYYKENVTSSGDLEISESYGFNIVDKLYLYLYNQNKKDINFYFAPFIMYKYAHEQDQRQDSYTIYTPNPYYSGYGNYYDNSNYNVFYTRDLYFHSFTGGLLFGFDVSIFNKISLDFYLGGGLRRSKDNMNESDYIYNTYRRNSWEPGYNGVIARAGIDIGIKF